MNRTPQQILETVDSARRVADELKARLAVERDVMDWGDLMHIQSTIKRIRQYLDWAAKHERVLRDRLKRTPYASTNHLKNVVVDHRDGHVGVAQKFLHRADVAGGLQQAGGLATTTSTGRTCF